ncbi:MAG TPA: zf-HC2 domain-containing protein [Planctomycetota bacterium]|nr:zf-HC2 domain-containing protein [Planctomycetota bacterium]
MIDCKKASQYITACVDGQLEQHLHELLDAHVAGCPDCEATLFAERRLKEMVQLHHKLTPAPDKLQQAIMRAIENVALPPLCTGAIPVVPPRGPAAP